MKWLNLFACALSIGMASGCATTTNLVVYTQPPGAMIVEEPTGIVLGQAPVAVPYDNAMMAQHRNVEGCVIVHSLKATWASGVQRSSGPVSMCGPNSEFHLTIFRPEGEPGLEQDVFTADQAQGRALQEKALKQQQDAAMAEALKPSIDVMMRAILKRKGAAA